LHNDKYISVILELPSLKRLSAWERKILRIYGPVVEQGMWRIRTNHELRELCQDLDIIADIAKKIEMDGICSKNGQGKDS